jgi:hypothetical protein
MKKLYSLIAVTLVVGWVAGLGLVAPGRGVAISNKEAVCDGVGFATGVSGCGDAEASEGAVSGTVQKVINLLSLVVGIVAVIMIIVGGLKYITSSGDSSNVGSAKNTILFAVVGLVIVLMAQVIVRFVINRVDATKTTTMNSTSLVA